MPLHSSARPLRSSFFAWACLQAVALGLLRDLNSTSILTFTEKAPWIVEFYAPWCSHCKKLLPVLEKVADYAGNRVAIGKIDATKYAGITRSMNVTKYPTVLFKTGHKVEVYTGPRTFVALTEFINKIDRAVMPTVSSLDDIASHMLEWHVNSSFVLNVPCEVYGKCQYAIEQTKLAAEEVKMQALIMMASDSADSALPRGLCKYDFHHTLDGNEKLHARSLYCIEPADRSASSLTDYIHDNNYPLVSGFEDHNFRTLAHLNKTMMLAVLDFSDKNTVEAAIHALQTTAGMMMSKPHAIIFGYIDGKQKKRYVKHYEIIVPVILIVDHDDERHAVVTLNGVDPANYETFFQDTMRKVIDGEITLLPTNPPGLWRKILHRFERYRTLAIMLFAAPFLFLLTSLLFPHPNRKMKQQ